MPSFSSPARQKLAVPKGLLPESLSPTVFVYTHRIVSMRSCSELSLRECVPLGLLRPKLFWTSWPEDQVHVAAPVSRRKRTAHLLKTMTEEELLLEGSSKCFLVQHHECFSSHPEHTDGRLWTFCLSQNFWNRSQHRAFSGTAELVRLA